MTQLGARHDQLGELFADATSLPPERRAAFVESASGISQTMRDDLLALLRFHETLHAPDLCGSALQDWLRAPPAELKPGEKVGPYVIETLLGRGGNGAVYAARQTGALDREVALKVLDLPEPISEPGRFAAERNAMALLEHPGIARIFDADVDDAGRAYIAMQRVEGVPLDQWHAQHKPALRQTLELIARVAEALEYAHGRGVIHRDVKPSNLLVSGGADDADDPPVVKVIDFGLVAATAGSTLRRWLEAADPSVGGGGSAAGAAGTPLFMAPEQAAPDAPTDVRADVYGVGAVLYSLLTGSPPLDLSDLKDATPAELFHAVEHRPRRSLRAAPADRRFDADLALICDKAIAPSAQRYENMTALIADLRRYLERRPISARVPTTPYVTRLFVSRNRVAVLGFGASALLLAAGAIGTVAGFVQARRENQHFRQQLAGNEAVNRFLADDLLGTAVPGKSGKDVRVVDLLDRAGASLDRRFGDRPLVNADLRLTLGESYTRLGEYKRADEMLSRGLALLEANVAPGHPQRTRALASLGLAKLLEGELDRAEPLLLTAANAPSDSTENQYALAAAHGALAQLYDTRGKFPEALEHSRRAIELLKAMFDQEDGPKLRMAEALNENANILADAGRDQEADRAQAELVGQIKQLLGPDHFYAVAASASRAATLMDRNQYAEALPMLEEAMPVFEKEFGPNHPTTLQMMGLLTSALGHTGQNARAVEMCRKIIPLVDQANGKNSVEAITERHRLAAMLLASATPRDALAPADEAAQLAMSSLGENHWLTGQCIATRGFSHEARREYGEAIADITRGGEILKTTRGAGDPRTISTAEHLNRLKLKLGLSPQAAAAATQPATRP